MFTYLEKILEWLNPRVHRDTSRDRLCEPLPKPTVNWQIYRDRKGLWRWRVKTANGEIIAASCEGYSGKHSAEKNLERVTRLKIRVKTPL